MVARSFFSAVSASTAVPINHPAKEDTVIKSIPATITPTTIEAATIILESIPDVTGIPKRVPAMLRPMTPPRINPLLARIYAVVDV